VTAARPEVWLRGPIPGVPNALQPAAHALLQAQEDLERVAAVLSTDALWARPGGVASVGFHVRHAAGSLERLLTYARGEALSPGQIAAVAREGEPGEPPADASSLLASLGDSVLRALAQFRSTDAASLGEPRAVGRARLPSTVVGLLFHAAEHAQRHAGQAITTARIVLATDHRAR
jgi:hypothetical protein